MAERSAWLKWSIRGVFIPLSDLLYFLPILGNQIQGSLTEEMLGWASSNHLDFTNKKRQVCVRVCVYVERIGAL